MSIDEESSATISWRLLALGSCGLVITFGGLAIGLWSQSMAQRLDTLASVQQHQWEIIQQRANLLSRMDTTERQVADQEQRIREVERQLWKQRH